MARANLVPIKDVDLKGETIKTMLFVNTGGDKTIIVFESGRVLVMPVYRECPVQAGSIKDLVGDFPDFISRIEAEKQKVIDEAETTISIMKELSNGLDSR